MKIKKVFNQRKQIYEYKTRFQLNNREFYPVAASRSALIEIVDEIRAREHRVTRSLTVLQPTPTLRELFEEHQKRIGKKQQRNLFGRVSSTLLALLPPDIKITDLKKSHFQQYIDLRRTEPNKQTGKPVLDETIDKEIYSIQGALGAAPLYFAALDNFQKPVLPKAARGKKRRRNRLVNQDSELNLLLKELRKSRTNRQTEYTEKIRHRLADDLEFRFETGLRRLEVARLKVRQFYPQENCLRDVIRWKTNTVTEFFPLSRRAAEIITNRIKLQDCEWIFSNNGEPVESSYRTLKNVCAELGISYGRYTTDGACRARSSPQFRVGDCPGYRHRNRQKSDRTHRQRDFYLFAHDRKTAARSRRTPRKTRLQKRID